MQDFQFAVNLVFLGRTFSEEVFGYFLILKCFQNVLVCVTNFLGLIMILLKCIYIIQQPAMIFQINCIHCKFCLFSFYEKSVKIFDIHLIFYFRNLQYLFTVLIKNALAIVVYRLECVYQCNHIFNVTYPKYKCSTVWQNYVLPKNGTVIFSTYLKYLNNFT